MNRWAIIAVLCVMGSSLCAADEPDEANRELARAELPPPLIGQIELTIDDVSPMEINVDTEKKKDVGGTVKFSVVTKNLADEDFPYSPGKIGVFLLNGDGKAWPREKYRRKDSSHGGTGTYPLAKDKWNYKPIVIEFDDEGIKPGTKYMVVAMYVDVYDKPRLGCNPLVAAKMLEASREKAVKPSLKKAPSSD